MPHQCTTCGHVFEDGSKEMLSGCPDCGGNKFQFRPGSVSQTAADAGGTDADEQTLVDEGLDVNGEPDPPERPDANPSSVAETVGRATTKVRDFVSSDSRPPPDAPNADAEWPGDWNSDSRGADPSERSIDDPPERSTDDSPPDRSIDPASSGGNDSESDEQGGKIIDADARRRARENDDRGEDVAQASARTDVVSPDELDGSAHEPAEDSGGRADESARDTSAESTLPSDLDEHDSSSTSDDVLDSAPDAASDRTVVSEPTGEEADLADLREQLNDQFESIKVLEPGQYELNLMELYDREEYIIALQENGRYVIQVPEQWMGEDPDDR